MTLAYRGMVAAPHALASEAGVEVLKAGGSAVDAAIAANAVLNVVYPHMSGIGGDAFWLIYDSAAREVRSLNAAGRAASGATIEWFRERGMSGIPHRGVVSGTLTVPGSVDGWCEAHGAYGRLPLRRLLEAAIDYARDGFPVTAPLSEWTKQAAEVLQQTPEATIYLPGGEPPREGQRMVLSDLAQTLELVADGGRGAFYEGEVAREICKYAREHGGFGDEADWADQRAEWGDSVSASYRSITIHETPPPTQGVSALQALNLVEHFDLGGMDHLGPDHVHLLVEAAKVAFHDRNRFIADPEFADVPSERLISKAYAEERANLIHMDRVLPWDQIPSTEAKLAGDTVYVCAVDAEGNAASLIQSLYMGYGSGVVAGKSGVLLQNRGAYFSLDPEHPNRCEPRKQPFHTLIASLAFNSGDPWAVFGAMGADGQPQIHLQFYTSVIDFGRSSREAIESPRWLFGRYALGEPRNLLNVESRFPTATLVELEHRGHLLNRWGPWQERVGHANGIVIQPGTGALMGASDPRSAGAAIGY
jgi:gamma-glutamyltranspeptidase